ncbi:two-component system sensor histidine kinase EnvZ [Glaciecola sp. 1036]|uniref:two-component system sensor histidine kinase EnvZ n=1 Tax=Alteromonadaceae TaxID=72275 RepID=UPI003D03D636
MRFSPKSTFAQTAMLIGGLLLINQLVSYLSVTHYFINPSYSQINSLVANQLSSLLVSGVDTLSNEEKYKLKQVSGIDFHDNLSAMHAGISNATYYDYMSQEISEKLNKNIEVRIKPGKDYMVWIKPYESKDTWLSIPLEGIAETDVSPLSMYFIVIGALSVFGGWLFVRRLNRPLQALQKAAINVGHGKFPEPLPLEGSSEMVAVTQAFNKMSANIRQLEADRNLMTAGISHDLRTPLTRIRLSSEMLPDEHNWIKEGIEHDIEDMNAIIDQFIDFARQDREEKLTLVSINHIIEELAELRRFDENHNITLDLRDSPKVKVRLISIKRVIENLIENAFRYGSPDIVIKSRFSEKTRTLYVAVKDFGNGIADSEMEKLFNPFEQGDKARGSQGSGLGLAIIKRIVEGHGGQIAFSNHSDGGLEAGFTLPVFMSNRQLSKH